GASVVTMRSLGYVGALEVSKWKPAPANLSWPETLVAVGSAGAPLLFGSWQAAGLALVVGAAMAALLALTARRLLGGYTGDVLGGVEQVFELGFMLGAAAAFAVTS
ncbi:MAG TPA: adenosylcobinamide-GDP ribazoletransferase, partial [Phenylobacterium sp.]